MIGVTKMKINKPVLNRSIKNLLKGLWIILVVISGIIVLLYCCYKIFVRPPEIQTTIEKNTEIINNTPVPNNTETYETASPQSDNSFTNDRKPYCYTFLFVASDQSSGNADTIMVMSYDTVNQEVGIVSIPRDTLVDPDGPTGYPKINSAYHGGVERVQEVVSDLLGIPIDFYITIDVEGFVKLVDSIGGIDFNIPIHMSYDDPYQNLHIHFEPGLQHLSGEDALNVCRLRKNSDGTSAYFNSDIGRTETQRNLLIAIAKKVISNPQKIQTYLTLFQDYVSTNLKLTEILWFVQPVLSLDFENDIYSSVLPGDGNVTCGSVKYCYQLYPEETLEIVNDCLNPFTEDLVLEELNIYLME